MVGTRLSGGGRSRSDGRWSFTGLEKVGYPAEREPVQHHSHVRVRPAGIAATRDQYYTVYFKCLSCVFIVGSLDFEESEMSSETSPSCSMSPQTLVEVPVEGLAAEMAVGRQQVQVLQDTLQSVLDRREEERQSKQLLQLYLEALKKEGVELTKASDAEGVDEVDSSSNQAEPSCNQAEPSCNQAEPSSNLAEPSCKTQLTSHIVKILKEKDLPHLSFSNEQLEAVTLEDTEVLAVALDWKEQRTREVQGCCREELQRRAEQVQCLNSLASQSQSKKKKLPWRQQL
ncbi:hypothetical protein FKM82_023889 [Ascaphus truei]